MIKKIGQPLDHRSSDMQLRDLHGKWGYQRTQLGEWIPDRLSVTH